MWRPKKSKHKIEEVYVKSLSLTLLKHVFLTPNQDPWSDKSSCRYEDSEKNWNVLETSALLWPWLWKIWMESMLIPNSRIPISTSLSIYWAGDGLMRKDLFYLGLFGQRHKLISLFYWDFCEFLKRKNVLPIWIQLQILPQRQLLTIWDNKTSVIF